MDISPHVNLLRSLRAEKIDHLGMICEGVDNAFDADAHEVSITFEPDEQIVFQDNGIGIMPDNIEKLFSLGAHAEMKTTRLGRFGIGIKAHAARAGNILDVDSVSAHGRVRARADWLQVLKSGKWIIDDPKIIPCVVGTPTGSLIWVHGLRAAPSVKIDALVEELAKRFYPAIAEGRCIVLNNSTVPKLADPPMIDVVECNIALSEGRGARLRAGILCQPGKLHHVHVGYEHRVIMPGSSMGCREYSGLQKMFARVQLTGRAWHLARFKDDLTDEAEREELEDAVHEVLLPILEKCTTASMSARVDQMTQMINDMVPPNMQAARPKRKKKEPPPSPPRRKNPPGIIDPEKSEPHGPAKTKRPPQDRLLITFDGRDEEHGIGEFQSGRPHRVDLSRDNALIAKLLEHRDMEIAAKALTAIAIALYEHRARHELEFVPFGKRIANLLAIQESPRAAMP